MRPARVLFVVLALVLCLPALVLADPSVATTATGSDAAASTSRSVTLPTSVASGDHLIGIFGCRDNNAGGTTVTWPGDWTVRHTTAFNTSVTLSVAVKISSGSEPASITISNGTSAVCVWRLYRVSGGHASSLAEAGTPSTAATTTPNPPAVTPSTGSDTYLVFAIEFNSVATTTVSAYPTNYTSNQHDDCSTGSPGGCIGSATRVITGTTENPGTFTIINNENTVASTVAVRNAAAGAARCIGCGVGTRVID